MTPKWPEWMQVNAMDANPFEPGGLYVAGTRYKSDDFHPYLYKTDRLGEDLDEDHRRASPRASSPA